MKDHPGRFIGSLEIDPNDVTGAVRKIRQYKDEHDIKAVTTFPAGCNPQVPVDDRRYYPIYQTCIDLDIPIVSNAGIAGPRFPSDVPGRDAVRPGLLRLPRAAHRDAPRRRAVGRAGGEAHAEVAEPLLHAERVRAQALPEGDHRLRQHPRRRQDHVRRLLPDGPEPGAHLHRDARRAVPRPRVAQVPTRQRDPRLQARREASRRETRPAPDRVRGQRPRRGGDRGRRRGPARWRVGAPHRQERQGVRAGRRRVLREAARHHVQLGLVGVVPRGRAPRPRARRRGDHVGGDVLDRRRTAGARRDRPCVRRRGAGHLQHRRRRHRGHDLAPHEGDPGAEPDRQLRPTGTASAPSPTPTASR